MNSIIQTEMSSFMHGMQFTLGRSYVYFMHRTFMRDKMHPQTPKKKKEKKRKTGLKSQTCVISRYID